MTTVDSTTATRWDALHRDKRLRVEHPSEHVVRFLNSLAHLDGYRNALDIGCGNGRHLELLEAFGYSVWGVDSSYEAVRRAEAKVRGSSYDRRVWRGDMRDLGEHLNVEDYFDVALAFGVFYYGTMGQADQAVHEMHRVLRPGGHGFVSVRSCRDWRGDHMDYEGVFRCEGEPEDGMQLDFISEDELRDIYGVFGGVSYEIAEWTSYDRDRLNSDWLITVQK